MRAIGRFAASALLLSAASGCGDDPADGGDGAGSDGRAGKAGGEMILATTTSTVDSGLLDTLLPEYERSGACSVKALGVGSGEAMRLGSQGNADALLVHSPTAEQEFMAAGDGSRREAVMYNDFVLVGPADDPADVAGAASVADALARVAASGSTFVSRDDGSGTNAKELELWAEAGVVPGGDWYEETGQGMGETLTVTSQLRGYTLSDRGSYLATGGLDLDVLSEGGKELLNPYHVIVVDAAGTNRACAEDFADWLLTAKTQQLIGEFGVETYGQPLFVADARS